MINYFILANLYGLLLYSLYFWTLKNSNRHAWSRFYLLLTAVLPLLLPLFRLPAFRMDSGNAVEQAFQLPEVVLQAARQTSHISNETGLFILYIAVVMLLLGRLVYRYLRLYFFLKKQHYVRRDQYRIAFNTGYGPASFGSSIILPGNETDDMILHHEAAHLKYRHHYDKMMLHVLECICFPVLVLHLVRRELEIVHEFEADCMANTDTEAYALLLVNRHFNTNQIQLLQSFFHHPLKRRIMMLQQSRKGRRGLLLATLAVTITGIIVLQSQGQAMAQKKTPTPAQSVKSKLQKNVYTTVPQMPDPGFDLMQYLAEHIKYPESARKSGVTGHTVAKFIVDASGSLRDIEIVKPLAPDCDAEVIRVLKTMPDWKPGMKDGKPVSVYYTLPVNFRLK